MDDEAKNLFIALQITFANRNLARQISENAILEATLAQTAFDAANKKFDDYMLEKRKVKVI